MWSTHLVRLVAFSAFLTTLGAACNEDAHAPPEERAIYNGPESAVLATGNARVKLALRRFRMQVENASGRVLLDTLTEPIAVDGDDVRAYGALATTHNDVAIRASVIEGYDHVTSNEEPWIHGWDVAHAAVTDATASIELFDTRTPKVTLRLDIALTESEIKVDATVKDERDPMTTADGTADLSLNMVGQSFRLPPDEHFFGLGEREASVDHRGRHYTCWTEEGGLGGGEAAPPGPSNPTPNGPGMTHVPIPFFISSRGYGLWLDTSYKTGFSFGADTQEAFRIYSNDSSLHYRILVHDNPLDTIAHFTQLTGRAALPAPWVFGPRRRVDIGTLVDGIPEAEALRTRHVPTTMVDDTVHFLPNAEQLGREADLSAWTARLHSLGYKAISYFNAYVSATLTKAKDLLAYGRAHNLFVRLDDGSEFITYMISGGGQNVATIDLTNPEGVAWFESLMKEALDIGYDGWMLDFGEYLPPKAKMHDGTLGFEAHNRFPVIYERAAYNFLRRVRGDDFMFFARSGYTGTQAFAPVVWSGDPSASFDEARGLPAQVRAGINAGISGIPFWGSDISGFTCLRDPPADKEVYLRWAEFGALSTDMHDENACAGAPAGTRKWTLWSDAETTKIYGDYARLHTRLFPYLYTAAKHATETGAPVIRHPFLVHPTETEAFAARAEYYFGPALYVAPVVHRGERRRELWLPPGEWFDFWTFEFIAGGGHVTRDAPLSTLPLFLRVGELVPMLDADVETLANAPSLDVVGMAERNDVLDVRGALSASAPAAKTTLVDGTTLVAMRAGGIEDFPADIVKATSDSELATCARCAKADSLPGGSTRVRVSATGDATAAGISVTSARASSPIRVRWDIVVK
jgi:sulfoquinovosidase